MTIEERLEREYTFGPVNPSQMAAMEAVRDNAKMLALEIVEFCPDNRARSLALTSLQQAKMWAVQSIVDGEGSG